MLSLGNPIPPFHNIIFEPYNDLEIGHLTFIFLDKEEVTFYPMQEYIWYRCLHSTNPLEAYLELKNKFPDKIMNTE